MLRADTFTYSGWSYDPASGVLDLGYRLGEHEFTERFTFGGADPSGLGRGRSVTIERLARLLHLVAGISYFKAANPPVVVVEGPAPSEVTQRFLAELYLHGLAEYAYLNGLDPVRPEWRFLGAASATGDAPDPHLEPNLVLCAVGGGKDSVVAFESLRTVGADVVLGVVGTMHEPLVRVVAEAGLPYLQIQRRVDPELLRLNEEGALNGHVPVTAINSLALCIGAVLRGASSVVVANEASASVPVADHRGLPVNHQWSKGLDCETLLQAVLAAEVGPHLEWFSLLRPFGELEIVRRFAALRRYHGVFTSCNAAFRLRDERRSSGWCRSCPKCRFVAMALALFLPRSEVVAVLGGDLLDDADQIPGYRALLGIDGVAFECVGTRDENRWAMAHLAADPRWADAAVVRALAADAAAGRWAQLPDPLSARHPHRIPDRWLRAAHALGP